MNILDELNKRIEAEYEKRCENSLKFYRQKNPNAVLSDAIKQTIHDGAQEDITISYFSSLDYKDMDIREQLNGYAQDVFAQIGQDKQLSRAQLFGLHVIVTKSTLADLGCEDEIFYSSGSSRYEAERDVKRKVITFYKHRIAKPEILQPSDPTKDRAKGIKLRFIETATQLWIAQHEIEHTVQEKEDLAACDDEQKMTSRLYLMSIQDAARKFSNDPRSKFYDSKTGDADKLYHDNHDQFYMELDSDKVGFDRTFTILKLLSPEAYAATQDRTVSAMPTIYNEEKRQLENYQDVTWRSEAEEEGKISACHLASKIITDMLPKLTEAERAEVFKNIPALGLLYKEDGTKKTLKEVEAERSAKRRKARLTQPGIEGQIKSRSIDELYEVAEIGDVDLSAERRALADEKQAKKDAEVVLKNVFPNFDAQPTAYEGVAGGSIIQERDNIEEKMRMLTSQRRYQEQYSALPARERVHVPTPRQVLESIYTVYDFRIPIESQVDYQERLSKGLVEPVASMLDEPDDTASFDSDPRRRTRWYSREKEEQPQVHEQINTDNKEQEEQEYRRVVEEELKQQTDEPKIEQEPAKVEKVSKEELDSAKAEMPQYDEVGVEITKYQTTQRVNENNGYERGR